jgi:hypothetical protein
MVSGSPQPGAVLVRVLLAASLTALAAVATACGGGGKNAGGASSAGQSGSREVVAQVGSTPITRGQVNHWMSTLAGGDYFELSAGHTVPEGLVSDPPRYSACVAHLEAAAAAAPFKATQPSSVQLLTKCRQLNQALRLQAAGLLVEIQWLIDLAAEEGISISNAEILAAYNKSASERFSSRAALSRDQAARRISVSDELLLIKKNLAADKLVTKLKSRGGVSAIAALEARWKSKIDCRAGYVVERCKQYQGAPPPSPDRPPASVLIEQVAALATGRCTNKPACGHT